MGMKSLIGAALIAASILAGMLLAPAVAPYRVVSINGGSFWYLNARTGELRRCLLGEDGYPGACTEPWTPGHPLPNIDRLLHPEPKKSATP